MKILILLAIVGLTTSQQPPKTKYSDIQILRFENVNNGDGTYNYAFENSDGTSVAQKGYLKPPPPGSEDQIQVAEGFFRWVGGDDGVTYNVDYKADENGFQPTGEHLPTAPPIPPEILKALSIIYDNAGHQQKRAAAAAASNLQPQQVPFRAQSQQQRPLRRY